MLFCKSMSTITTSLDTIPPSSANRLEKHRRVRLPKITMSESENEEYTAGTDQEKAETLCGDPDCSVCSAPGKGTCADGFSNFVDFLNGGGE